MLCVKSGAYTLIPFVVRHWLLPTHLLLVLSFTKSLFPNLKNVHTQTLQVQTCLGKQVTLKVLH